MTSQSKVAIIGAGLAGAEAAWQLAKRGHAVDLYEMRPVRSTEAHKTGSCAELVCSNSFKSRSTENAHGLLKAEIALFDSLILQSAELHSVPAGQALAVDRDAFSNWITQRLEAQSKIQLLRQEVEDIEAFIAHYAYILIATGPLTSIKLANSLQALLGTEYLAFYDAIAPIITADSIDLSVAFLASRYDKGDKDYINCPMNHEQYDRFVDAIQNADKVEAHSFEHIRPFEGCLPIEVMVERGKDTLRFGPMKPVGLKNPHTGEFCHAVVQLRRENRIGSLYNMVGFQTKMTWPSQQSVFRMIPSLENAEFVRMGSMHRNTFINSPQLLNSHLQLKLNPKVFFAGQITGVEGYIESTSSGVYSAHQIANLLEGKDLFTLPATTMMGALVRYITQSNPSAFQPINSNFGLLEPPSSKVGKKDKKLFLSNQALSILKTFSHHLI